MKRLTLLGKKRATEKEAAQEKEDLEQLNRGMDTALESIQLMLNNDMEKGEALVRNRYNRSCYLAMAYGGIKTVQCIMTVDKADIDATSAILTNCIAACQRMRSPRKSISPTSTLSLLRKSTDMESLTDAEKHAELCYAEVSLYKAIVSVSQDDSVVRLVKALFQMRTCHKILLDCESILPRTAWSSQKSRDNFTTGVRLGLGSFNLMMSLVPPKQLRMLQVVGFPSDKVRGERDLLTGFRIKGTVRTFSCGLILLVYHMYPAFLYGTGVGSDDEERLKLIDEILSVFEETYPEGSVVYYLRGRREQIEGNIEKASYYYQKSIDMETYMVSAHQAPIWEQMFNTCLTMDWAKGINLAKILMDNSNWSKCTYCYFQAIILYSRGNMDAHENRRLIEMMKMVPTLLRKVGGKVPVFEEFAINRAQRFLDQGNRLVAPLVEIIYLFNGFRMLRKRTDLISNFDTLVSACKEKLTSIGGRDYTDDNVALWHWMKGVCVHGLGDDELAKHHFEEAIKIRPRHDRHVSPFAHYEIGVLHLSKGDLVQAKHYFRQAQAVGKSPYILEHRLTFRIHAALDQVEFLLAQRREGAGLSAF